MPKRISKKLLVGLGSIITFGTVGTVSGFGIKSIIDATWNNNFNQLNTSNPISSFTQIPDFNVATKDMFIPTKNLTRFHFGNTQIGQKVTPWGWLGVFDDEDGVKTRIALTGWNGEIIWVNETYKTLDKMNVYDMQYDFNSNLIFVLRTKADNGFYEGNDNNYPEVYLEVLDAKTGKKYTDDVKNNEFESLQREAKNKLINDTTLLDGYDKDENIRKKTKNLYYLDVTYSSEQNAILATWMPNYMQMARQKYSGDQIGSLPSFQDVINTWDEVATSFMFNATKLSNDEKYSNKKRQFELDKSSGIIKKTDSQGKPIFWIKQDLLNPNDEGIKAENIFLLTNPFFTTSHDGNAFVMHLIGATELGAVYHKTIGWKIDLSDSPKKDGEIYEYTGGNVTTDKKRYDNIQILNPDQGFFSLKEDKTWTMAKGWEPGFISANLRVNKNMFDENSIVFAYPYSSSALVKSPSNHDEKYGNLNKAMPVFNVAQIWLDKNNAFIKSTKETTQKDNINYNFGKQIDDYYQKNGTNYEGKDSNLNEIYPYPTPLEFDDDNVNHSYNRLISVSPFDNTIIYAAKPNIGEEIFGPYTKPNKDKWAGFWIANTWDIKTELEKRKYYHPLIVANDDSIVSSKIDKFDSEGMNKMLNNINDLYQDGFTFDIASSYEPAKFRLSLNLYFNQTGSGVNNSYENKDPDFRTSKIGLIRNVLYDSGSHKENESGHKGWGKEIVPKFPGVWNDESKKLFATTINNDSFSSLIHSRADLTKWYPRTWANLNWPSNMLKAGETFAYEAPWKFAVATEFNKQLKDQDWVFSNKESIDLVSAWRDYGETNQSTKYSDRLARLIMNRPIIVTGSESLENGLKLLIKYPLSSEIETSILEKRGWEETYKSIKDDLTLTQNIVIKNTSVQILSAWGNSYKMKKIGETTGGLDQNNTFWNQEISVTDKLDKKDYPNEPNKISFGNGNNNNMTRNGTTALRLMLKLVKPQGILPNWFNGIPSYIFNKAYPLEPAYSGETTFKDIVKEFANEKAKLIDLSDPNNAAVGLGNLKIDAYLELNPKFANYDSNDKIYNVPGSGKGIIDKNSKNQLIIYKDSNSLSRNIYDQSAINYDQFSQGGFGSSTSASWSGSKEIGDLKNIKVTTDYNQLPNTLVRKQGDNNPLLTFDFKDGTNSLELTPNDSTWFLNHFKNFNRLIGLFIKFEYQAGTSDQWIELTNNRAAGNIWTDQEITQNLQQNQNKLLLPNVPHDIKKLRFKLVQNPNNNDPNAAIDITGFNPNDSKYISDEFRINVQRITVDNAWISEITLTNPTNSLIDINETDITKFETSVLAKIADENQRNQVKLVYQFENSWFNLTAAELAQKIKEKFTNFSDINNNQGVFGLWDGTNGQKLIQAKFMLKNTNNEFKLITAQNPNPTDADLSNDVKSTIKSKIDISDYINQLTTTSIEAAIGDQPGQIKPNSIKIPAKLGSVGSDRFNGKSFDEIKTIFASQGISIKFKQWENGDWSTNWLELSNITSYAQNKPEIQLGFVFDNNKVNNIELTNQTNVINNGTTYTLKLNLPKIVKLPTDEQPIKDAYNNSFGGNTKHLTVDSTKIDQAQKAVLSALKKASGNDADYAGLDQVLEFKYQIGNSSFLTINELKAYLESEPNDQTSNALKLKVDIITTNGQDPEFALEENLKIKEFELLPNDNKIIKKWLHGTKIEKELKANTITVTGSKADLKYSLGPELSKFNQWDGKYTDQELVMQYQLLDKNNQPVNNGWTDGYLPDNVPSNVNKIQLRVGDDKSIGEANKIYIYGPEQETKQTVATIDLSQIATLIKVDPNWFLQEAIVDVKTDSNNLTSQMIKNWEEKIYSKIDQVTIDPDLKNKLIIKYEFIKNTDLTSSTLAGAISSELTNYGDATHHGIVKLYDKNVGEQSGYKIKATFEKKDPNDPTIKFVDSTNTSIDGEANKEKRTGVVDTSNIITTINLTDWIKNLIENLTVVKTTQAGTIPEDGLEPPVLNSNPPNSKLFAGQTFKDIEKWLKSAQVKFWWTKDENGNRDWKEGTEKIREYDATKKKLWFALDNQSTNLVLTLGNSLPTLDSNKKDNKDQPIEIKLDAPATINIHPNKLMGIAPFITGNTKELIVDKDKIAKKLEEFKKELGSGFEQAPLTIMIKVGNEAEHDYKKVADELLKLTDDVDNGIVVARFEIDRTQNNASKFELTDQSKSEQQIIGDDGTIKVYINDKGLYNDLQATIAKGSSKALKLEWQNGISVNEQTGVLTATNPIRGNGLKIEYTFNTSLNGGDSEQTSNVATDVETKWVAVQPTTFRPGVDDNLFIRIRLVDPNKYVYENINKKITIDLTKLKSIIELDPTWLDQPIAPTEIELANFGLNDIDVYETKVLAATNINAQLKDKIEIKYNFNDHQDIDKNKLNELILNYKNNNKDTKDNLGILQFANGNEQGNGNDFSEKIIAKFAVKPEHQALYELEFTGGANNEKQLNTSNIFTTIDFSKVIKWLTETSKLVEVQGDSQSAIFKIPNVNVRDDDTFNEKEWSKVEQTLKGFGITIQYREILDANSPSESDWKDNLNQVKKYDENIGKIGLRFKFDKQKSINIKLKVGSNQNDIYNGKNQDATGQFELSLKVRLTLKINENIVNVNFVEKEDSIKGNTKFLTISDKNEELMIKELIKDNAAINAAFNSANLIVKYKLEKQSEWKNRQQFIDSLSSSNNDQSTNTVLFKFEILNDNDFTVEDKEWTLFDPTQTNPEQWKVKIFINNGTWEKDAKSVAVTGKTSNLIWKWNDLNVSEQGTKVGNEKLQVEFTAKSNPGYDDNDVEENGDLRTKWTLTKPTTLDSTIQDLYIRIKAKPGYVYGPAYDKNGNNKIATVHRVNLQIKREILVDPKSLLTSLSGATYVSDISKEILNKFVEDGLNKIPNQLLKEHVTVKFNFNGSSGLNSEELYLQIQSIITNNNEPNYGILQLWNGSVGEKIEAYYEIKDHNGEYELITVNNTNPNEPQELITGHIKTKINLIEIVEDLKTKKIEVELITNKNNRNLVTIQNWIMPNTKNGSAALNNLTWEKFEERLKNIGVIVEARVVNNPDNSHDWKPLNELKQYDDTTLKLALRFKIEANGSNIVLSLENGVDTEYNPGTDSNTSEFNMNIKAPATVVVDEAFIQTFISKDSFTGNTKILKIHPEPEKELIQAIVNKNLANNADIFKDLQSRLEVQYYLGQNDPDTMTNIQWRSAQELVDFLAIQNLDQSTNQIWFRLNIKETNDPNAQIFQIDKKAKILTNEDISANAQIKIYINETGFENAIKELKAVGSTDGFTITGINEWITTIPNGLEVWYSNQTDPNEEDDNQWTQSQPTTLNTDKKLWIRFKVKDGYIYQNARQDNDKYSNKHSINTDGIKVIIKLQKSWLEQIEITGNTKEAKINEDQVMKAIDDNHVLPTGETDLIELEYSIKGTNEWFIKEEFTNELIELAGWKDSQNFILRREELLVRFNIKEKNNGNNYGLNINNQNIDDTNRDQFNVQMVDDNQNHNQDFAGYINLDKLTDFVVDNFHIIGSTSKPKLIITNRNQMNTLFMPYASEGLFDIEFSTIKQPDGSWDWSKGRSILKANGQLIEEDGLITQGVTIGPDKFFAIRFIAKNPKYKVYFNDSEKPDGQILDISSNVKITVEIINPFTAQNKTLALWTREENGGKNIGKYYQGQGGFKIAVANKDNFIVENNGQQSAQEFLEVSNLADREKEALELVFHIFGPNPSEIEIEKAQESINDYKDETIWKSFDTVKENSSGDWSKDLGLKVGDYVAVALRVKKQYATQDEPFILKDNDYSMILPVMNDQSGVEKKPGRISGYKVNTDMIEIEQDGVIVSNIISSQLPPLDGWSELQKVDLKQDEKGNYLGINLKLELYNEFYEDTSNRVLVSGSGLKLVKRQTDKDDPSLTSKGNYKDKNNADIKDKNNQTIQIWKDKNNRLSAPKKAANVTKDKLLTALGDGSFRMPFINDIEEKERFSLFRNQDLDLKLEANFGEGDAQLPDFYLDNDNKQIDIKEVVSKQIKFIVENEDKISYSWNQEAFAPDQIQYKAPGNNPSQQPEDGNAQIETIYKLIKKTDGKNPEEITGDTALAASTNIAKQLNDDFDGQLKFETTYTSKKGHQVIEDGNDIYKFTDLSNKDRIMVKIVAVDDDLFYVTDEPPLVINVNGLTEAAPDPDRLQYLRVKQGGLIDGQGSFKVLVSNPDNDNEDDSSILKGWKFMIRVWDKDPTIDPESNMRKIKINWTSDPAQIKGLANGDKVEWKLVSDDGNPVKDAYYNTIALKHQQKPDGNIDYRFGQVNYAKEDAGYDVIKSEIGAYPDDDNQYPEDSGFVISGLKPAFEVFKINQTIFEKIIKELNPFYVGFDHQGTINFDNQYLENEYWVNTKGEIYLKELNQLKLSDSLVQELPEIPIKEFLNNVTFFTQDPILFPYQNGFKFEANDVNIDNHLANGDSVWAQFNMVNFKDEDNLDQKINTNQNLSSLVMQLPDVSGLKNIVDPMSPFWYVLMALAGILTLGTTGIIAYVRARHKKLKGKN